MGMMCSWIAVKGAAKAELLKALDVVETGEEAHPWYLETPMSFGVRPGGWMIIYSKDPSWSDRERVRELSRYGLALGTQYDDKTDSGTATYAAEAGRDLWHVRQDTAADTCLIEVSGEPPVGLAAACDKAQAEFGDEPANWYGSFDALPGVLARSVCDYSPERDDRLFTGLRPAGQAPSDLVGESFTSPGNPPKFVLVYLMYLTGLTAVALIGAWLLRGG